MSTIDGTAKNDTLTGTAGSDIIDGGNGNDTMVGYAGNDVAIMANKGDSFDGGSGIDTLRLAATANFNWDFTSPNAINGVANALTLDKNIEILDIRGNAASANFANTVKLSMADVLNMGSTSLEISSTVKELFINGDSNDHVQLSNKLLSGTGYGVWTLSTHTLTVPVNTLQGSTVNTTFREIDHHNGAATAAVDAKAYVANVLLTNHDVASYGADGILHLLM